MDPLAQQVHKGTTVVPATISTGVLPVPEIPAYTLISVTDQVVGGTTQGHNALSSPVTQKGLSSVQKTHTTAHTEQTHHTEGRKSMLDRFHSPVNVATLKKHL